MNPLQSTFEFGPFRLDAGRRRLLRDGQPVALTPKALETLVALVERRDRVITKDELLQRIWGDAAVEEGGLTRNVSILRKTLGERPDDHQYIVTVPGQGYRFVAEVREPAPPPVPVCQPAPNAVDVPAGPERPEVAGGRRSRMRRIALGGLACGAAALLLLLLLRQSPERVAMRAPINGLAVLPLDNLSGDASEEYFADGMTEALIANLARVRALRVVSRTSVMRFKGASLPLPQIARMLNVDAVVEGSVQRIGGRVRINVQLIHAASDTHLWTRTYEDALTDILTLQAQVARAVAEEIRVQVTAEERARLASPGRVDPMAYQEYLLGQHYLWRLTEDDLSRAIDHFERSARLDPGFAATQAGLSHAWWWRGIWGATTRQEVESPARAAAVKAVGLGPHLPEAHVSMGRIKFGYERDWAGARHDFTRALEIDPNNADAHLFSAMLCMALGCFSESIAHMHRVEQLDPLSPTVQSSFGRVLYRAHRFDEAIVHFKRAIELAPYSPAGAYHRLAEVYEELGRYDEALALIEKAATAAPSAGHRLQTARIYARMGRRSDARAILAGSPGGDPYARAMVYAALGDNDEAFPLLLKAIDENALLGYANTDPKFDTLHADPRWQAVLRSLRLPTDRDARTRAAAR